MYVVQKMFYFYSCNTISNVSEQHWLVECHQIGRKIKRQYEWNSVYHQNLLLLSYSSEFKSAWAHEWNSVYHQSLLLLFYSSEFKSGWALFKPECTFFLWLFFRNLNSLLCPKMRFWWCCVFLTLWITLIAQLKFNNFFLFKHHTIAFSRHCFH
jgi:hypothetical protein